MLKLLEPFLVDHRTVQMALYFSLAFDNVECAKLLVSDCGGNVLKLCEFEENDFAHYTLPVICRPSVIPHLPSLGLDICCDELRYPYGDPMSDDVWSENGTLLDFAMSHGRWDSVRVILELLPKLSWKATKHAIEGDDESFLSFLQCWCHVSDEQVERMRAEVDQMRAKWEEKGRTLYPSGRKPVVQNLIRKQSKLLTKAIH